MSRKKVQKASVQFVHSTDGQGIEQSAFSSGIRNFSEIDIHAAVKKHLVVFLNRKGHSVSVVSLSRITRYMDLYDICLLHVIQKMHKYKSSTAGSPNAWIYRVVSNKCIDVFRRSRKSLPALDVSEYDAVPEMPWSAEDPEHHARLELLSSAMELVSAQHKRILTLRYLHGMSTERLSEAINVKPSSVGVLVMRSRRAVRCAVEKMAAAA